jgi:DNA modification methylase
LQLEVIRRAVVLWSNRGDLVFSPFAGIGSEGYVALQLGRRFIGAELKQSYFKQAKANLASARAHAGELFRQKQERASE